MQFKRWISLAQMNGWRLKAIRAQHVTLRCDHKGCHSERVIPVDQLGPPPDPCPAPHHGQYARAVFDDYRDIVDELRRRRAMIGLDQIDLTDAMGVADGYVNKLESYARTATGPTLALWAKALGYDITFTPAPLPPATVRAIDDRLTRPYQPNQARTKHGRSVE